MQGDWHDHINGIEGRESGDHEGSQWSRQGNFALILEEADRMLEWRRIRVQSPGLRIRRRTFGTGLANMVWAVGRGNGRREGVVTTGASRVRHEGNLTPAVRAKMGDRIIC